MKKRNLRRALYLRAHRIWWPRLVRRGLFVLGGIMIGVLAVAMALMADKAQGLFFMVERRWPLSPLLITPAGFALSIWLTRRYFDGAQGSGIPQVIAARHLADPGERGKLVSIRLALAKIGLLTLGLAAGASSGREGPTVQVGAAAMFALGRLAPHRQPGLLLAGSAAGVAAAFNAPLAGIMFGIEEMSRSFEVRTSGLILATVIAAGLTSLSIVGDYTYFGTAHLGIAISQQWLAVPVVGILCGLAGGLFARVLILFAKGLPGLPGQWLKRWPIGFAALCGLILAIAGLGSDASVFGTGYEQSKIILDGGDVPLLFGPLKLLATIVSSVSGIPGGIFSPSLSVGAGIGYDLSPLFPYVSVDALAILCMAAYLAGVVQAPLTALVIVSEMTADHALVFPIMLSAFIATAVSKLVCPEGVYHALARRYTAGQNLANSHAVP